MGWDISSAPRDLSISPVVAGPYHMFSVPMPEVGDIAPDFTLPSTRGEFNLRTFNQGKKLVIAFYVEDGTPG